MSETIILASGSPRRKELLAMIEKNFVVRVSQEEEAITSQNPADVTVELSRQKAEAVAEISEENPCLIIAADTVVAVDDAILGKPANKQAARAMIEKISGRTHQVYTGVTLIHRTGRVHEMKSFAVCTEVHVAKMEAEEVEEYISTEEPYDKAGAYGIQGLFGKYVTGIEGDYNNVVGLPVARLYQEMKEIME